MSVLFLIQGPPRVASSRTRAFAYLPFLREAGVGVESLVWNSERFIDQQFRGRVPVAGHLRNVLRHLSIALRALLASRRHETIYVQKVILPAWFMDLLRRGHRRLVFDYDDALYALGPEDQSGLRAMVRRRRVRRFTRCLEHADLVVLENEPNRQLTERYCPHTLIITGPIDTDRYQPAAHEARDEVVIGWVGSPSTTVYLRMLAPVLQRLAARHRLALHLIGAAPFSIDGVTVRHHPWTLETEVEHLSAFDIGIMPLIDEPWSRGKGGYKILQYMAMGIPTVASPVGINADLVRDGETGLLAQDEAAWTRALDRLLAEADTRRQLGIQARAEAVARYSLQHYAPRFLEALLPDGAVAGRPVPARDLTVRELRP